MTKNDLPTVDIKGREYVMVKDRIAYFNEKYPFGSIETEMVRYENGHVIVKAIVSPHDGPREGLDDKSVVPMVGRKFTGYSQAKENDGYINKTSALENAETSAVGRALAMMGIGVIESIASADEMVKATTLPTGTAKPKVAWGEDDPDFQQEIIKKGVETDQERVMREAVDETTSTNHPEIGEDICPLHGKKMLLKTGPYGEFYSHGEKQDDGTWLNCNGKSGYK